jgi:hypothetical protein
VGAKKPGFSEKPGFCTAQGLTKRTSAAVEASLFSFYRDAPFRKVQQQPQVGSCSNQIVHPLDFMGLDDSSNGFQLSNDLLLNHQVCKEFADT